MDLERARQMHRLEIAVAAQHFADPLGRPGIELGAEIGPHHGDVPQKLVLGVPSQHDQPALDRRNARHARLANGDADVFGARGRQRP
jgi:hypothetical protein